MAGVLQVRAGESVNNYEITRFAQLFNDELTLDNLERIQLVNLCRFVGIPPFGTDAFLASRLRAHLARIKVTPTPCQPFCEALPFWLWYTRLQWLGTELQHVCVLNS